MLELKSSRIKGFYMNKTGKQAMNIGDKKSLYTVYHVNNDTKFYSIVRYVGPITWTSNNLAVVSVDKNGSICSWCRRSHHNGQKRKWKDSEMYLQNQK